MQSSNTLFFTMVYIVYVRESIDLISPHGQLYVGFSSEPPVLPGQRDFPQHLSPAVMNV